MPVTVVLPLCILTDYLFKLVLLYNSPSDASRSSSPERLHARSRLPIASKRQLRPRLRCSALGVAVTAISWRVQH